MEHRPPNHSRRRRTTSGEGVENTRRSSMRSTTLLSLLAGITALASAFHAPVGSRWDERRRRFR